MNSFSFHDEDLFLIPDDRGKYLLYAPLRRAMLSIDSATASALQKHLSGDQDELTPVEIKLLDTIAESSLFQGSAPKPPLFPINKEFSPHEVTLFLTSRCNLRCTYCYADAGKKEIEMPWETAKAAIDLVARNAGLLGSPKFAVGFHGGGEPTVAWKVLTKCVDYAHQKAEELGLDVEIFAASNGLLNQDQREYIARKFTTINISLDGPEDVQNLNRPKVNGSGSWKEISQTIKYFQEQKFHFGLRATITAATVKRMPEIVECFTSEFSPAYLHMEPAWACGRCLTTGERPPSDEDFIKYFLEAAKLGEESGLPLHYSGARLDTITSKFCAAPGDNFTVLPEGKVTSCYEITEDDDPRAKIFHYGQFNRETKIFDFDHSKIAQLKKLTVDEFEYCKDCFCKWHCAGDCLSKVFQESGSQLHQGSNRCEMNRTLTKHELINTIVRAKESCPEHQG